jgi:nucleotide-binding universal stress UspA family protein
MYRSIIVPLDGSARSHDALPVAANLAEASGATLHLVRVHLNDRRDLANDPSWDAMFREGELRYLEALAQAYEPLAGGRVETALLEAPVVESFARFATSRVAPLVGLAGPRRPRLRRAFLGSTSDGLVRHGEVPVLVLRDRPGDEDTPLWKTNPRPFHRIVVPLDGSVYAEGGIAHAVAIARAIDARLRLVRVIGPVMTSAVIGAFATRPLMPYDESTVLRNDAAQDYLQAIVDRINAEGPTLHISTEVALSADPATAIIESCRRAAADLIVMASHGRGASRLLRSAVGDRVLRDGPDAILFVKPDASRLPAGLQTAQHEEPADVPAPVR